MPSRDAARRPRLVELVERELVVAACLKSALHAIRLGLYRIDAHNPTMYPPEKWLDRAESSLLFAAAELSYLASPAPAPLTAHSIPFRSRDLRGV